MGQGCGGVLTRPVSKFPWKEHPVLLPGGVVSLFLLL